VTFRRRTTAWCWPCAAPRSARRSARQHKPVPLSGPTVEVDHDALGLESHQT
jgi:hypothetical protein